MSNSHYFKRIIKHIDYLLFQTDPDMLNFTLMCIQIGHANSWHIYTPLFFDYIPLSDMSTIGYMITKDHEET